MEGLQLRGRLRRFLPYVEVAAITLAAVAAIALVELGVLKQSAEISIILVLLAIHTLHEITNVDEIRSNVRDLVEVVTTPEGELDLIKSNDILRRTEEFGLRNAGEDWWFNTCVKMFGPQYLFDKLIKSSMVNPKTTRIFFVLRPDMKEAWDRDVAPKIERAPGREKVQPGMWRDVEEGVSLRIVDVDGGSKEALLTVWGEPFMQERSGAHMSRYVVHVKRDSELLIRLWDLVGKYRLSGR